MRENDVAGTGCASATVGAILDRYAPRILPTRVEPLPGPAGFSGAAIWRVTTSHGQFALRRWPNPGMPRERVLGLHQLLQHHARHAVPFVAVPLPTADGTTLPRALNSDWQLEPWMPGVADYRARPSLPRLRAAMAALARWHLVAARFCPAPTALPWFGSSRDVPPTIAERLSLLQRADETLIRRVESLVRTTREPFACDLIRRILNLFQRGRQRVHDELLQVREIPVPLQPCLRDVWHDHVLFSGDEVTGLIDPSACRTDSVACDLSRLVGSLVGDDSRGWSMALADYERHRPLSTAERSLVAIFHRSGVLLSGWTWLDWLYIEGRRFPDSQAVLRRLIEIRERMEFLVEGSRPDQLFIPPDV